MDWHETTERMGRKAHRNAIDSCFGQKKPNLVWLRNSLLVIAREDRFG